MHRINLISSYGEHHPVGLLSSVLRIPRGKKVMDQNRRTEPLGTREKWAGEKDWRDKQCCLLLIGMLALSSLWKES